MVRKDSGVPEKRNERIGMVQGKRDRSENVLLPSTKSDHLHLIYLPYLRFGIRAVLDFVLMWKLVHSKYAFYTISVRQTEVLPIAALLSHYIRLLSDTASQRMPLSSANSSYCQVCSGLSPPSGSLMPSTRNRTGTVFTIPVLRVFIIGFSIPIIRSDTSEPGCQ